MNGPSRSPCAIPLAQAGTASGLSTVMPSALCVKPTAGVGNDAGDGTGLGPIGRDATAGSRSFADLPAARAEPSTARALPRSPARTEGPTFHPEVNDVRAALDWSPTAAPHCWISNR